MARTAAFSIDDSTPTSGQTTTVTLTFVNDGAAVTIASIANKVAGDSTAHLGDGAAAFLQNAQTALVGATLGASATTVINFPAVFFSGSSIGTAPISVNFTLILSDGAKVVPTAQVVTVSPPTMPGTNFPTSFLGT